MAALLQAQSDDEPLADGRTATTTSSNSVDMLTRLLKSGHSAADLVPFRSLPCPTAHAQTRTHARALYADCMRARALTEAFPVAPWRCTHLAVQHQVGSRVSAQVGMRMQSGHAFGVGNGTQWEMQLNRAAAGRRSE